MATENPALRQSAAKDRNAAGEKPIPPATQRVGESDAEIHPLVRIAPGAEGVSIWSPALFAGSANAPIREFLERVFAVKEVSAVELRRTESFGRVVYDSVANAREIWRKLSRALHPEGISKAKSAPANR